MNDAVQKVRQMTNFQYRPVDLYDVRPIAEMLRARDLRFVGASNLWDSSVYERLHGAGFELDKSSQAVEAPDGTVAGFEVVYDNINPLRADLWGHVDEAWRGQGIGSTLIAWAIERASQNIASAPPEAQVSVASMVFREDEAGKKLLTDHGFQHLRSYYVMKRNFNGAVEVSPLPEGCRLVTYAERPDLRLFAELEAAAFKDHFGWIDTPIEEEVARWQHYIDTAPDFDPNYWWIALYGDEPAGMIMTQLESSIGEGVAWVNSLGVKREYRKRGLASALLEQAFAAHQQRGSEAIALGVDASSLTNAVALYERAGMSVYSQRDSYEKVLREGLDLGTH